MTVRFKSAIHSVSFSMREKQITSKEAQFGKRKGSCTGSKMMN